MVYFTSSASANGTVTITATFEVGTNVDMASVNVNNRVRQPNRACLKKCGAMA